jgi:glutamyl-Q tRNA(Asp) synthetase
VSYIGRFAPSPTGPLHAGSLVAALASWLDARAHQGQWLVRIEDVDRERCVPGATDIILQQLATCGLHPDGTVVIQSQRDTHYQPALNRLVTQGRAYPCACTRSDIAQMLQAAGHDKPRHGELIYPGNCRTGLQGRQPRAWRFLTEGPAHTDRLTQWTDRRLGAQAQDVARQVGDFVLRRADGYFAYQLAVVVDDAAQGITHVVRGEDLADNTARQILLQRALNLPAPSYLHTPLVLGENREKLSKQNGALPLDLQDPVRAIQEAAQVLSLTVPATDLSETLRIATQQWAARWRSDQ